MALGQGQMDRVAIFDTTLRDGEQAPGFSMAPAEKLLIARILNDLKVDVIEAGFAAASPGDAEAVRLIASEIHGPTICAMARLFEADIDVAAKALAPAKRKRIHALISTSPIHREAKLKLSKNEILNRISDLVRYATSACEEIEFCAEDAFRTERAYLIETVLAAVESGARVINLPDTVGYATPEEVYDVFKDITARVPAHVVLSAHCHDDLGLAVANSLAAVRGGARQIECTINGIAERAGLCALEEVVMAIATRADHYKISTGIETRHLYRASQTVARVIGNAVPRNKAVVGQNAFSHESGIHQHGVLADRRTYEVMNPDDVGAPVKTIVLGKHSGRAAIASRLAELGLFVEQDQMDELFPRFKEMADKRKEITDEDLMRLAAAFSAPAKVAQVD